MKDRPDDYATVVRRHHHRTVAWLLADQPPCTDLRTDEIERIERDLRPLRSDGLSGWTPGRSWLLAVLLCPDDDLGPLVDRLTALAPDDLDRVRFYAHPDTDIVAALRPWYAAGFGDPPLEIVSDWKSLHPPFGRDLNDRVYRDAARPGQ